MAFSRIELTSSSAVKGSLTCTDCAPNYDFSGIKVLVKCDGVKKLSTAVTESNGGFTTQLPTDSPILPSNRVNCLAKLIGGQTQIYALKNNMVSKIVLAKGDDDDENTKGYTLVSPLFFSESCHGKCDSVGSSKTINLPIPPEYGLPPTSYYLPFLPIIGIP